MTVLPEPEVKRSEGLVPVTELCSVQPTNFLPLVQSEGVVAGKTNVPDVCVVVDVTP